MGMRQGKQEAMRAAEQQYQQSLEQAEQQKQIAAEEAVRHVEKQHLVARLEAEQKHAEEVATALMERQQQQQQLHQLHQKVAELERRLQQQKAGTPQDEPTKSSTLIQEGIEH